ncbi:MAG: ABC transporter ATP-binding protein [Deinococcales bacterium]
MPSLKLFRPLLIALNSHSYLGMTAAVGNALFRVLIVPILVQPLVDQVFVLAELSALYQVAFKGFWVIFLASVMLFWQDAMLASSAALLVSEWRERLYGWGLGGGGGGSSASLSSRILNDLKDIEIYIQYGLGSLIAESLSLVFILILLFKLHLSATFFVLLSFIPLAFILWRLGLALKKATQEQQQALEKLGGQMQEGFKHRPVIKAFNLENFMLGRFKPVNDSVLKTQQRRMRLAALQTPIAQILGFLAIILLIILLGKEVLAGRLTLGQLSSYLTLLALLATPSQLLPRAYAMLQQAKAAEERLSNLEHELRLQSRQVQLFSGETLSQNLLSCQEVYFSYGDKTVLKGLNFSPPDRGLCLIMGESGVGKSSFFNLLLGFALPQQGQILLAGRPVNSYSQAELSCLIAYVPQDTSLLQASIWDNLCLGRAISEAALWQILEKLQLASSVRQLPQGLHTLLSEDGQNLSGGQRQRLAVARALLGEPKLLLLDEASAHLDEASEVALYQVLEEEAEKRLIITISHHSRFKLGQVYHLHEGNLVFEAQDS